MRTGVATARTTGIPGRAGRRSGGIYLVKLYMAKNMMWQRLEPVRLGVSMRT